MCDKQYFEDIICARATPPGISAIAVIRISGKNSWNIINEIFISQKNNKNFKSHHAYYGEIVENNNIIIDNVILIPYADGKSFTGEESFEINCHGNEVIISLILKLLVSKGIRLAEPGEFSKRAFLNGKIDLIEAEAIMDIIHSSTQRSALIAFRQLSGLLSSEINKIKDQILNLLAEIEVDIDYPEEDLTLDSTNWVNKINNIRNLFNSLLEGYSRGRFLREGIESVILGKTNSGKSTLFNFLLNEDKAIVSDIHGTTRDYLDGVINVEGFGVRIYDTAGLRESNDPIEREGSKRAIELSKNANFVFYVISAKEGLTEDDIKNLKNINNDKKIIIILNKIDLIDNFDNIINDIKNILTSFNYKIVSMSALKKTGLNNFNKAFLDLLIQEKNIDSNDPIITNIRHAQLIEEAEINLNNSLEKINEGLLDLAAFEIRESLNKLGEITGEITPNDVINKIFSTFCVGK